MKLCVLTDNNTFIDQYYLGEPAVSYYIEADGCKILFDVGYSDVFLYNSKKMALDLNNLTAVVLSHGHNDHTGGLPYLCKQHFLPPVPIIAHPNVFAQRNVDGYAIGSPLKKEDMSRQCRLALTKSPVAVTTRLTFLGEIPCLLEEREPIGIIEDEKGQSSDDYVLDDSALVYHGEEGLFIITGCSHSGIINILEYAKKVCRDNRIYGIIGGFHLFETDDRLGKVIAYLKKNNIQALYPCHCVSFAAKAEIHKHIPIQEVGVGLEIYIS